jgi:hypothetical protein
MEEKTKQYSAHSRYRYFQQREEAVERNSLTLKCLVFRSIMAVLLVCSFVTSVPAVMDMSQTLSDGAQRTTIAFSGLALMTGNLEAQSFFPPGKVADYTGFQYLRDNDPDNMGHNTSFLTRVANNVIYLLNDTQFSQLKTLAVTQQDQINLYGYKRFPLMKAFRRLLNGEVPSGSTGLNLSAVKKASRELYLLDGQISFDRALLYANICRSLNSTQKAYLDAMKGKGWNSWPDITNDQIKSKMQGLPQGTAVAVMTYAGDLFSWYAGSLVADVYFCPERHGTYFGSFYIKDAPAIGHEGYSINEQLTATAGAALSDSSKGYVTADQATLMSSLVDMQRNNLYTGTSNIVTVRTQIATMLRSLLTSTASSDSVKAQVLSISNTYGDLDGENNYNYATVFAQVYKTLTDDQKTKLAALRKSIMSGTYVDGTSFDYSLCTTPFFYSSAITDMSLLAPYITNTDYLFFEPIWTRNDFNGDGQTDLLWWNKANGNVAVWYMNGSNLISGAVIYQGVPLNWEIAGTGDFSGHGNTDILWRNKANGDVAAWYMDGVSLLSGTLIYYSVPLDWDIAGTGDFKGGGQSDILWRNKGTGDVALWYMNGSNLISGAVIYQGVPLVWQPKVK